MLPLNAGFHLLYWICFYTRAALQGKRYVVINIQLIVARLDTFTGIAVAGLKKGDNRSVWENLHKVQHEMF